MTTTRTNLTETKLKTLRSAAPGKRREELDSIVPGLSIRITDQGKKSYMLRARFPLRLNRTTGKLVPWPGRPESTRVVIAEVGSISLPDARNKARHWQQLIEAGVDPRTLTNERDRVSSRPGVTFSVITEDYIKRHLQAKNMRRAYKDEQEIRRELLPHWQDRLAASIERDDVVALVESIVDRGSPGTAHLALSHARRIYNWSIERGRYGLKVSPCDRVSAERLIGPKVPRTRVLGDAELRALWNACDEIGFPHGNFIQLILLTAARRTEASEAQWNEFTLDGSDPVWCVPAERHKSNAQHRVPLSPQALALMASLPRFNRGPFVFTTTLGVRPIGDFSAAKTRIDELMAKELGAAPERFTLHDLRHTVRTRLSQLRVPSDVAELVLGHAKTGLKRIYDQWQYEPEKRDALDRWGTRLYSIVSPPPDNVTTLRKRA